MPQLPVEQARQEYKRIAQREGKGGRAFSLTADTDYEAAIADAVKDIKDITRNLVERVSLRLAAEFRAGKTDWPERTGYSRSEFFGDGRGIINNAGYAKYVEKKHTPAENYVRERIDGVAKGIIDRSPLRG